MWRTEISMRLPRWWQLVVDVIKFYFFGTEGIYINLIHPRTILNIFFYFHRHWLHAPHISEAHWNYNNYGKDHFCSEIYAVIPFLLSGVGVNWNFSRKLPTVNNSIGAIKKNHYVFQTKWCVCLNIRLLTIGSNFYLHLEMVINFLT